MIRAKSIRFKVSLLYTMILGLILLGYSTVLYVSLWKIFYRDLDNHLSIKTDEVEALVNATMTAPGSPPTPFLEKTILATLEKYELRDDYAAFFTEEGQPLAFSKNIPPELRRGFRTNRHPTEGETLFATITVDGSRLRLITDQVRLLNGHGYIIQIATPLASIDATMGRLLVVILVSLFVIVLFAGFIGNWLVTNILRPVRAVAKTAEGITHDDLGARVQLEDLDEEMRDLVGAFNLMIERLEQSFRHISDFSSHVAHELKTPLAIIRGESEIALKKTRSIEEYREALSANLREAQRMIQVIEDMLFLSRLDYDPKEMGFKPVDLTSLLKDIAEKARILADPKKIEVVFTPGPNQAGITADEGHLRRLFLNIIDNAVKFTSVSGRITIGLKRQDDSFVVSLSDTGSGISEDDLPKVFDRFFRHNPPDVSPGTGLGLHIALTIAKVHGGDITVHSRPGEGTTFTVTLPAAY